MIQSSILSNKTKSALFAAVTVFALLFASFSALAQSQEAGEKVGATGALQESDNTERGNLMIESDKGKIYIQTVRDFSGLIGKEVVLDAIGTLQSFVFLGLTEVGEEPEDDMQDVGGPADEEQNGGQEEGTFSITGIFQDSDDAERGNYVIVTEDRQVYLQSVRDYSALVGQEVEMKAQGSLSGFSQAVVTQK